MADFDVVSYLASKGYSGRQTSGAEVMYPCFFECGEPADSRKVKLYINTESSLYNCFVCGASGGSYLLQKHFGDDPKPPEPGEDPFTRRRILNWAAEVGSVMLSNNDDILMYLLNERGLSAETILERKLGFVGSGWSLVGSLPEEFSRAEMANTGLVHREGPREGQDFFYQHLLIPYISRSNVVQLRGRHWGNGPAKYMTGPGEPVLLYNSDSLDGADDVVITEGEFDCMVLAQHLGNASEEKVRRIAVIGLAGANGFKQGYESYLADARRVFIALDPDTTGAREAVRIAERLGTKARIVELPPELPKCDWTEYLLPIPAGADDEWRAAHPHAGHTWQDVMLLLGDASGKRLYSVSEAGASSRRLAVEVPGFKLGFKRLDDIIAPGLKPGQVMVVLSKTGVGKTVLLCNLAWNMRDRPVLFISLEMTREEVYDRLRRIALFWHPRWTDAQVEDAYRNVMICDENRLSDDDILNLLDEFEVETGQRPQVAFVDYLGYFAHGMSGRDQYERATKAVMALKAVSKGGRKQPVAVVVPGQVNRGTDLGKPISIDDARDSGVVEETADYLLAMWRPDQALDVAASEAKEGTPKGRTGTVNVAILKSRVGGAGQIVSVLMDVLTLAIVDPDDRDASKKAHAHNKKHWESHWQYEDLRASQTGPLFDYKPYKD